MTKEPLYKNEMNPGYVKNITIKGLRSIKKLEKFELRKTNILIGANGAGKSNFLEAFNLIGGVVKGRIRDYGDNFSSVDDLFYRGNAVTPEIELGVHCGGWSHSSKLGIGPSGGLVATDENTEMDNKSSYTYLEEQMSEMPLEEKVYAVNEQDGLAFSRDDLVNQTWRHYKLDERSKDALVRGPSGITNADELAPDFSNLAPFLMGLRDNHPDIYKFLIGMSGLVIPVLEDFLFKPTRNEDGATTVDLSWKHKELDIDMQSSRLSNGAIRFIAMAACLLQPNPPSTIIIDEPELGMHPEAIDAFGRLVKNNMQKSQVIIATQSPLLVDKFLPEDVITVNHSKEGSEFKRLEYKDLDVWLENNTLGQLWLKDVVEASTSYPAS